MTATARAPIGLPPGAAGETAGEDARKYGTSNPVVQRLLERWLKTLRDVLGPVPGRVLDVGIGEGLAAERVVAPEHWLAGVELRADKLAAARNRRPALAAVRADAGLLPFPDGAIDTVLCVEVLEHLVRPDAAVAELARVTGGRCIVSVPWEPWFRLGNLGRGKHVRRLGNDPEHLQSFTPTRLRHLLAPHFAAVEVHRRFPWLVALASK